jgi:1,4-dihydroxy-2-naphthoate octaprenyltransferase
VSKLLAYGRLLKPRSQAASLCTLVAMSLACARYQEPRFWAVMLAFLAFNFLGGALICVLDDMTGYLDGSDRLDIVSTQKRNISKPLLTGDLTLAEARGLAIVIVVLSAVLLVALVILAVRPLLALIYLGLLVGLVPQYSAGLKLSYWGLGELLIAAAAAACVALPYWILEDSITPRVWFNAALVGIPYAAHLVIANVIDYNNDKGAGRLTIPVLFGLRSAPYISGGFLVLFWVLFAIGMLNGALPKTALLWLPLFFSHVRFMMLALRGDPARARLLSFVNFHLVFLLFSLANVLAFVLGG